MTRTSADPGTAPAAAHQPRCYPKIAEQSIDLVPRETAHVADRWTRHHRRVRVGRKAPIRRCRDAPSCARAVEGGLRPPGAPTSPAPAHAARRSAPMTRPSLACLLGWLLACQLVAAAPA